jgi:thiol-disulfide isomerase/thioredoxin
MKTLAIMTIVLAFNTMSSRCQSLIDGRILAADGTPSQLAHVAVLRPSLPTVVYLVTADSQGNFSLTIDSAGIFLARVSAVNHAPSEAMLYVVRGQPIHIDARLALNTCPNPIGNVSVIGSFNHYSFVSPLPMKRESDGTFSLEVRSDSSKLTYQLVGTVPGGRSINGQQSAAYELDPGGDYRSVVYSQPGKVTLRFDPHVAPHATKPAQMEIRNPDPEIDAIANILNLRQSILSNFKAQKDSVERAGKSVMLFKDDFDWSAALSPLRTRLATETKRLCRQALLVSFFSSGSIRNRDSVLAKELLAEVPPESRFWSMAPSYAIPRVRTSLSSRSVEHYMAEVIDRNPDPEVRAAFLFDALLIASTEGVGKAKAPLYYERLMTEHSGSQWAELASRGLSPSKKVIVGARLPEFRLQDLRDSTRHWTNASFKGKVFLLDFWATWCKPCVAEVPGVHRSYDKYHAQGLEVLSVSLDNKVEDIHQFLQTKDSMPWHHVFAPLTDRKALMDSFEFIGIPRPILVDRQGKIVATDYDLRGDRLDASVRRALGSSISPRLKQQDKSGK